MKQQSQECFRPSQNTINHRDSKKYSLLKRRRRRRWIRVARVRIPGRKRIVITLTYIFGIGKAKAKSILYEIKPSISPNIRGCDLTYRQLKMVRGGVEKFNTTEGQLRRQKFRRRSSLLALNSYRAKRHRNRLPVRGQRTRTNARTSKNSRWLSNNI